MYNELGVLFFFGHAGEWVEEWSTILMMGNCGCGFQMVA